MIDLQIKGIEFVKLPDIKNIHVVYTGRPNKCMCGCSGKYSYAKQYQKEESKRRGYSVRDDEVSEAIIKRVFKKMQVALSQGYNIEVIKNYIWTTIIGNTQYTIYTEEK